MPDQQPPTPEPPSDPFVHQTLRHFLVNATPNPAAATLTCRLPTGCARIPIPVPSDGPPSAPASCLADYMQVAADHLLRYHMDVLADFASSVAPAEVARAQQQVQDREDQDFHVAMAKVDADMHAALRLPEAVWSSRPRLRVAEEASIDDFMDAVSEKGVRVEHFHTADPPPHARENWRATHLATGLTAEAGVDRQAPEHEAITSYQLRARALAELREMVRTQGGMRPVPEWSLRSHLREAEEVSLDDFMTDPEIHARIESEARLPADVVRAGVEAYERVHPHDREDAEIIVRKVAAAALLAYEAARPGIEHQVALAKFAAEQARVTQLPGVLLTDSSLYVHRFVDRVERRIYDHIRTDRLDVPAREMFRVASRKDSPLVTLLYPDNRLVLVDTLSTVLQRLFDEPVSDLYMIAVDPDLLPRIDGTDPDAGSPADDQNEERS